jgi:hypothetical protein
MTRSIDAGTRARALTPPGPEPIAIGHGPLITGVRIFSVVSVVVSIGFFSAAVAYDNWRWALAAATVLNFAVMGGVVLAIDAMFNGRREFYQRGQLDGWMRGWRGQEPEVDDPLLHP